MAQDRSSLSPETVAIIERLTAEGNLLRNSGTNSVRSVKIELSKFGDVFKSISDSLVDYSNVNKQTLDIIRGDIEQSVEREIERRKELEEQLRLSEERTRSQEENEERQREEENNRRREEEEQNNRQMSFMQRVTNVLLQIKDGVKYLGKKGVISEAAGKGFDFAKTFFKVMGGLFIGYNFIKGIVNEMTGGKFTEVENKIKNFLSEYSSLLADPLTWLVGGAVALTGFRGAFKLLTKSVSLLSSGLGLLLNDLPIPGRNRGRNGGNPPTPGPTPNRNNDRDRSGDRTNRNTARNLGRAGAGVAGIAVMMGMSSIKDYLEKENVNTEANIAGMRVDYVDAGGNIVQGALLGAAVGGPIGLMVGGMLGVAWTVYGMVRDAGNTRIAKVEREISQKLAGVEDQLSTAQTEADRYNAIERFRNEAAALDKKIANREKDLADFIDFGTNSIAAKIGLAKAPTAEDTKFIDDDISDLKKIRAQLQARMNAAVGDNDTFSPDFIQKMRADNENLLLMMNKDFRSIMFTSDRSDLINRASGSSTGFGSTTIINNITPTQVDNRQIDQSISSGTSISVGGAYQGLIPYLPGSAN